MNAPAINEKRAVKLLMDLLKIPGVSCEEKRVADFVAGQLKAAGVPASWIAFDDAHKRSPRGGDVGNLICRFPGTRKSPRRLLMAHLDTVPLCRGARPVLDGDFIRSGNPETALGADNRTGVAAVLNAAIQIQGRKLDHPPVTFFFPVQEEIGLIGAGLVHPKTLGNPKLCFNWDSGAPEIIGIGATGTYKIEIAVQGLASHAGSRPERGVSAIAIAALAIADLHANGWHGLIVKGKKRGTSNIGIINAGEATNVVTDRLTLRAEARSHDPVFRERIVKEFARAFARAARQVRSDEGRRGTVDVASRLSYESFKLSEKEGSVVAAWRIIEQMGMTPRLSISNGGLDANQLFVKGLPTVTLGAGQGGAHTVAERVTIPNFIGGCNVALRLATGA